jgi:hypothetical protein
MSISTRKKAEEREKKSSLLDYSLTHSLTHSLPDANTLTNTLTHSQYHSYNHSNPLARKLSQTHSPLTHSLTHSLTHCLPWYVTTHLRGHTELIIPIFSTKLTHRRLPRVYPHTHQKLLHASKHVPLHTTLAITARKLISFGNSISAHHIKYIPEHYTKAQIQLHRDTFIYCD